MLVPNTNTKARCTGDDETPPRPGTRPVYYFSAWLVRKYLPESPLHNWGEHLNHDDRRGGGHVLAGVLRPGGVAPSGAGVSIRADAGYRFATCSEAAGGRWRLPWSR